MDFKLHLHIYKFNKQFAHYYLKLLAKELDSSINYYIYEHQEKEISKKTNSLIYVLECSTELILKKCISYVLYSTHPFHAITDKEHNSIINSSFKYNTCFKYYNLYQTQEHKENLFLYLEQLFQTHIYLKSVLQEQRFQENNILESLRKLSFINPYSTSNTLAIETSLLYQTHHYNISLKNQMQYLGKKLPIFMIDESYNLLKNDLTEKVEVHSKFQTNYHSIVLSDLEFKQLKEESIKAGVKMKISIFDFDYLDVKFIKDQFDVCISSFLSVNSKEKFNELISQYLYQAEFISSKCISVLTPYEISSLYLRKLKLKVVKKKRISYNSKEILLYIITRK
ncbi:MAG: hypothetical protein ACMXYB_05575 [Candidatus Woesearchaeota archaeon]